jgi:hypothetical protein
MKRSHSARVMSSLMSRRKRKRLAVDVENARGTCRNQKSRPREATAIEGSLARNRGVI